MADHVAVLRRMLQHRFAWTDGEEGIAALDHAIATCEQHAALVARLGELEKAWRANADRASSESARNSLIPEAVCELRSEAMIFRLCAKALSATFDDLARVVKEGGG